jgi:peptidoglycan/LPS O-acetylase OafA/YrhL
LIKETFPAAKSKLYFPQIDSIRGLSFIAIFLFHAVRITDKPFFLSGFFGYLYSNLPLGLEVFFVLSSFLLTWLGFNEYEKRGNFSFKNYFTRRALRIWPLYFFILFLGFIVIRAVAVYFHSAITLPNAWYYIFFIANFYTLDHVFFLRLLWTISVEEQFYLFWGLSLKIFYKNIGWVISVLMVTSVLFSIYAITNQVSSYFNTLTYLFDFACGASAAMLLFRENKLVERLKKLSSTGRKIFYSYLVFHFIFFYFLNQFSTGLLNDFLALICRYIFVIYMALFIARQVVQNSQDTFLAKNRFLILTGKMSYGLYCYHGITITLLNLLLLKYHLQNGIMVIIYFVINYALATISYFYLERPFLKLKQKLRRI